MKSMKQGYASLSIVSLLVLSACGGGSTTIGDTQATGSAAIETAAPSSAAPTTGAASVQSSLSLQTGRFVDSAVSGLTYITATQSGETGADGSFQYAPGEVVLFSIGDVTLPAVAGSDLITPLTVFNTDNIADTRVINLARLLQTLDVDGDAENGITISDQAIASGTGLTLDFASPNFDTQAANLVANSGSSQTSLIDGEPALDHFQETLFNEGVQQRPVAPSQIATDSTDAPPATDASASHPLVGTVHELITRAHQVKGTITILDDRTIEVSNFTYDGGGPSVFFYTGNNGNYSSAGGGRIIGPQLNGRRYNNETLILNLPDGVTLDDFDGLSVWCDIFFASFGDVAF